MNFDEIGEMALGSRLRALSTIVTEDAEQLYKLYDIALKPKWFPVFYTLQQDGSKSITSIAHDIGHSHPSVIKIVREMSKAGLVLEQKDAGDKRKNNILLTAKGMDLSLKIQEQYTDVENAIKNALKQTKHNLWYALQEFEYVLGEKSLLARVAEERKIRQSSAITIVDYLPEHHMAFKTLNEEWIKAYFKIEETDRKALNNPKDYILDKGGKILVAQQNDSVLGVCALIKMENSTYDYELAKMAVSPKAQGKGIGFLLGKAVIQKAKSLRAQSLYLESNTILKPAISLYEKLGFQKVVGHDTPYERSNIQMALQV
ncbi:bifunctional helix-turn-helix transcriptional regulator/GNAT family N-acetyltransferase [Spongiimicrobium salis]|uniref:bifunctional helix-turn-helix transcriptional regulator/GNAT family N-acetyltransferase n=1 Tax=Spongiimicrobium salis TaxID=1667022 RepID=UPI00374D2748